MAVLTHDPKFDDPALMTDGGDPQLDRAIQEMLGHASIGTTQIYTAVENSRLLDQHARHHPRNRVKK